VSILSTIVKCPCCGKSMYSNSKKPNKKDDKERFYYYCKNTRLEQQMDTLSVDDTHYDRKMSDYQRRYDEQYDIIEELEDSIDELEEQIRKTRQEQISGENVYELLKVFDELYYELEPVEKRDLMRALIERVELYPERQEDGRWVRSIVFQFPVPVGGQTVKELTLENETILETVVLMSRVSNEPR
jgi:site-specific DNA recombinase